MKLFFFTLLFVIIINLIYAQEPRPEWVEQTPYPPTGANFICVYGMGSGSNETEAEVAAWKNALFKSFQEGGLIGIKNQSKTFDKIFSMNDLETMIPTNVLPRRLICQTPQIHLPNNQVKVYILIQVKLDGSKPTDFYDKKIEITCKSQDFEKNLLEWNKTGYLREQDKTKYTNIEIIGIAVAKSDASNGVELSWSDANNLCNSFNLAGYKDWRLPTIDELSQIYHQKNIIGVFSAHEYWSSTRWMSRLYYVIDMSNGKKNYTSGDRHCRCVRTLP